MQSYYLKFLTENYISPESVLLHLIHAWSACCII